MTAMLEAIQKGQKRAANGKKRKKRSYDSISDSDSEQETGSSDTSLGRDDRLKLDKPDGINFLSTTARPIKVTKKAHGILESPRANEIAKSCKNSGKVTAVAAIMTVFSKKYKNSTTLSSRKTALGVNLKELVLDQTNSELNKAKSRTNRTIKYDKSASKGLIAINKTIRVLLDSGSSGDLLFLKKGASKDIPVITRAVPKSWGTSNGTFVTH